MLSKISWADYLQTIACALTVYYVFIVTRFYSHDLMHLIKGKQKILIRPFSSIEKITDVRAELSIGPEGENQNSKLVQALTDEIQALVSATGTSQPEKKRSFHLCSNC